MPDNPLRYAMDYGSPDNPLTQGSPTWADAAQWHAQNAQQAWAAAQDPAMWQDAARQYGNALLMGTTAPGFRAFHGSPYDFERFSADKIGTGEGAQAYGHGLYFADREGVARAYRDALQTTRPATNTFDAQKITPGLVKQLANDPDPAIADFFKFTAQGKLTSRKSYVDTINDQIEGAKADAVRWQQRYDDHMANPPVASTYGPDDFVQFKAAAENKAAKLQTVAERFGWRPPEQTGKMYEVNIGSDPAHFLDWDKPLSEQSPAVRDRLQMLLQAHQVPRANNAGGETTGSQLYNHLYDKFGGDAAAVAQELHGEGIPGIRYLDAGSRAEGGTSNTVVFDPATIEILRKYGIAGLIGGGGAAAGAAAQQGEQ